MWHFSIKQILYNKVRSVLTLLAISSSIVVILVLRGFEQGLYLQSKNAVLERGGDLILTQSGVSNFLTVRSSIPQLARAQVESVKGVKIAHPITGLWVIYGSDGNKFPLYVMVYESMGGVSNLVEGRTIKSGREIVIDRGLARRYNLGLGDPLIISDFEFTIVGITTGNSALFSTFSFVNYDGLIDLFLESEIAPDISTFPLVSFLLVELMPTADLMKTVSNIESQVPSVDVYTLSQLANNDMKLGEELFGPIMSVLISLSYVIGMLVIGLIIFADVSSRRRSYGIMKALGFRMRHIVKQVLSQNAIIILLSLPLGILLAIVAAEWIEWAMPVYEVYVMEKWGILKSITGVIVMSLLGSLLPLRKILEVDPVLAFKSD